MRRDNHRLAMADAGLDRSPLDDRQFLVRTLDPQVPAGHHDPVRCIDQVIQIDHRLLVLDFCNDKRRRRMGQCQEIH